jgi:hypothetical protein
MVEERGEFLIGPLSSAVDNDRCLAHADRSESVAALKQPDLSRLLPERAQAVHQIVWADGICIE